MNVCEAGHRTHESHEVDTLQGPMLCWKTALYMDTRGYCTGQDDVSRTLELYGVWEKDETAEIASRLNPGDTFLDFGAHIGWFTLLAAKRGCNVHAFEGDLENLELLRQNARLHGVQDLVTAYPVWVDADAHVDIPEGPIRLVKIDLEGNDDQAIRCLSTALDRVEEIVCEVSPCFNDRYPAMVATLQAAGFEVADWDGDWGFHQRNFWFRRP